MATLTARRAVPAETPTREEVVARCMPLVRYVARRVESTMGLPAGVELADLISTGVVGLLEAYDRFDPRRGVKFETFAILRIRGAIVDELRSHDWVPRNVRSRARRLNEAEAQLTSKLGRAPRRWEVAEQLGVQRLDGFERISRPVTLVALEGVGAGDPDGEPGMGVADKLADLLAAEPGSELEEAELRERLVAALDALDERQRLILTLHYFEGVPLGEVARVLKVTESRVSQLHTRALATLRERLADR